MHFSWRGVKLIHGSLVRFTGKLGVRKFSIGKKLLRVRKGLLYKADLEVKKI